MRCLERINTTEGPQKARGRWLVDPESATSVINNDLDKDTAKTPPHHHLTDPGLITHTHTERERERDTNTAIFSYISVVTFT